MPQERPIFLFAFANDLTKSLRLEKEERKIRDVLAALDVGKQIEYKSIGQTTLEDIYSTFNQYHKEVYIFHYGGHSDRELLFLSEGNAWSEQFANLLGQQDHLKLVFLNGCANEEQVNLLLNVGIPAVIVTRSNVNDNLAIEFSTQFYHALANKKNIREAFQTAVSYVQQVELNLEVSGRGVQLRGDDGKLFPWRLVAREESGLVWKIPMEASGRSKINEILKYGVPFLISVLMIIFFVNNPFTRDSDKMFTLEKLEKYFEKIRQEQIAFSEKEPLIQEIVTKFAAKTLVFVKAENGIITEEYQLEEFLEALSFNNFQETYVESTQEGVITVRYYKNN